MRFRMKHKWPVIGKGVAVCLRCSLLIAGREHIRWRHSTEFDSDFTPNIADGTKVHHTNATAMASGTPLPEKKKLQHLLRKLKRKDKHDIFAEPVDPQVVIDYDKFIQEPMDLGTISTKLDGGSYRTMEEFQHDVTLVWRNAMDFNDPRTIYYKQAREIQYLATKLFTSLKTEAANVVEKPSTGRKPNVQYRDGCGETLGEFPKRTLASDNNTFTGLELPIFGGESSKVIPARDTRKFSYVEALLEDESPEWDTYGKPGFNLHEYQSFADIGSYSSNVEEADRDRKRFRPTEAPSQPLFPHSSSAGWSSQWLDNAASTSDVMKPISLKDIDEWFRNP